MNDPSAEEIRRRMSEARSNLTHDVGQVAEAAREMTDWRTYVRRYPWLAIGGAAMAGFFLVSRRGGSSAGFATAAKVSKAAMKMSLGNAIPHDLAATLANLAAQRAVRAFEDYFFTDRKSAQSNDQPSSETEQGYVVPPS